MSVIETGVRGGAIALLALLALVLLRDGRTISAARYGAVFCLGAAANLVVTAPAIEDHSAVWLLPLRIMAWGNPAWFWVLATALFDDEFRPDWRHATAWVALVAAGFWAIRGHGPRPFLAVNALSLICVLAALWHVLAGQAGDLVEARRRLRVVFVVTVAIFTTTILSSAIATNGGRGHLAFSYADAFGNLVITLFFAAALVSLTPDGPFQSLAPPRKAEARTAPDDPREAALLAALRRELEENRAYREEALSIAALAGRLGIPEYRLRRLINQRLGHRNFSAFLNGYRLEDVISALSDASQAQVPILTIALDAGFQSIGPFNRAFRAKTGMTPSEYRRERLAGGDP